MVKQKILKNKHACYTRRVCFENNGFTIIEVLISTIILSLIVFLAVLSYSTFLNVWSSKRLVDIKALDNYRAHILLRYALESVYDYFVTDPANENIGKYYPYFKGKQDSVEFVTLSSIFHKGLPAAARLRMIKDVNDERQDLVYEEAPLSSVFIKYNDFEPDYKSRIIQFADVKGVIIRYYGLSEIKYNQELQEAETIYRWQETFSGQEKNVIPEMIELLIKNESDDKRLIFPVKLNNYYKQIFFDPDI